MNKKQWNSYAGTGGFTMIEVLVTVVILSIGLLGLAALQARGQQFNHTAYSRSQATLLAYEIADKMRANWACARELVPTAQLVCGTAGNPPTRTGYAVAAGGAADTSCDTGTCTPAQMRSYDVTNWAVNIARLLPAGVGTVQWNLAPNVANQYTITVQWQEVGEANPIVQRWIVSVGP